MSPTPLYIVGIFYDAFDDQIFEAKLPVQNIDLKFYNRAHNNLNDLEEIRFKGKIHNTAEGSILLGCL